MTTGSTVIVGRPPRAAAGPLAGSGWLRQVGKPGRGARRGPGGPPHWHSQSGQSLVLIAVLLVFVLFGFLGFAVDLGRLYLIRGELNVAAEQMALVAAQELAGTSAAADNAQTAIDLLQSEGNDNRFNFGSNAVGGDGPLVSEIGELELFSTFGDATGTGTSGGSISSASEARYLRVTIRADAPLTFWRFLPVQGIGGTTSVQTTALAGISAPVCTACGIEPLAVSPVDFEDTTDFGWVRGIKYTFYSQCTGAPAPPLLANTADRIQYTVLNRSIDNSTLDTDQQLFQLSAGGIPAPPFPLPDETNLACPTIGGADLRLPQVSVAACTQPNRGAVATGLLCGLNARLNQVPHTGCVNITDIDTLIQAFPPDTDIEQIDDYTEYAGNRRRIFTVAVVDAIPFAVGTEMNVLGFRQFLLEPDPDSTELNPNGQWGRFTAMYIGFPAPVKQGSFGTCGVTQGPGKVVLH